MNIRDKAGKWNWRIAAFLLAAALAWLGCWLLQGRPEGDSLQNTGSDSATGSFETRDIPADYLKSRSDGGKIAEVLYDSKDYASDGQADISKTAYVYLPAGYDASDRSTRYNILYLMHGWQMTAGDFFNDSDLKTILDNMIAKGDIPPTIVVTPTFDAENAPQDFARSEAEIRAFHQDFRNHLVPFIESTYRTYADGVSEADFQNSRSHRAFAGFSGGSVTTWSQFLYNLDYIRYFGPMSGDSWELEVYGGRDNSRATVDLFEGAVEDGGYAEEDFLIFAATGTEDFAESLITTQVNEMRTRRVFTPKNLLMGMSQGSSHDLIAVQEYLYNMLPHFFEE